MLTQTWKKSGGLDGGHVIFAYQKSTKHKVDSAALIPFLEFVSVNGVAKEGVCFKCQAQKKTQTPSASKRLNEQQTLQVSSWSRWQRKKCSNRGNICLICISFKGHTDAKTINKKTKQAWFALSTTLASSLARSCKSSAKPYSVFIHSFIHF